MELARELGVVDRMMELSEMGAGFPLLNTVARSGPASVIDILSQAGADVNPSATVGTTPLHPAAIARNEQTTRRLLELGADPSQKDIDGLTPVERAIHSGSVKTVATLIEFSPGSRQELLGDLLHRAVSCSRRDVIDFLLIEGADIDRKDQMERTPLHEAAALSVSVGVVALLMRRGADVTLTDLQGRTALFEAVRAVLLEEDRWLRLNRGRCLEILIDHGADVNWQDKSGNAPLHMAVMKGWNEQVLECLFDGGASVHLKNLQNHTPLHVALQMGQYPVAEELIRKGAQKDAIDSCGFTPLGLVLLSNSKGIEHSEFPQYFLDDCSFRFKDGEGRLPVHLGAGYGTSSTIHILTDKGRLDCLEETDSQGSPVLHYAVLSGKLPNVEKVLSMGSSVDVADADGITALSLAVQNGADTVVSSLIERGANANVKDTKGRSPLYLAVELDGQDEDTIRGKMACIEMLVSNRANLKARDVQQRTPLMVAVEVGNTEGVEKLVNSGADTTVRNKRGQTLLQVGRDGGNEDIVNVLEGKAKSGPGDSSIQRKP